MLQKRSGMSSCNIEKLPFGLIVGMDYEEQRWRKLKKSLAEGETDSAWPVGAGTGV